MKGFFFIVFLALRIRISMLKVLKNHNILEQMPVNEIVSELPKIERIVEKGGTECFAALG
ncbi:hypothetical protein Thermo_01087 [Thermoplasmatales archaeon]|nr:hypothetical protein Thermo_01087 [Thermoplasmatales archaeon]